MLQKTSGKRRIEVVQVRTVEELKRCDALIIPGGGWQCSRRSGGARTVFGSNEPKDVWWELCKSGADTTASLIERGVSLSVSRWLRQWLELGSPAHEPVSVL